MHEESLYALRALRAGAKGYVMKPHTVETVRDALRTVLAGEVYVSPHFRQTLVFRAIHGSGTAPGSPLDNLTDRELEVFRLVAQGEPTSRISEQLRIAVKTVETHRAHIMEKLGFQHSTELVAFAKQWTAACDLPLDAQRPPKGAEPP